MPSRPIPGLTAGALSLLLLLAWDSSGGDRYLANWAGGAHGFALREHWALTTLMHSGGRVVSWALCLALCLGVWWPMGMLRRIDVARRLQLAGSALAATLVVVVLKDANATSCPWALADYGGVARHVGHWRGFLGGDGGGGHCFPAGQASAGFAYLGGYFVWREPAPRIARWWLGGALAAGLVLGVAQQLRGAHFMSHTLWTAWLCWVVALASDGVRRRLVGAGGPSRALGPA
jgi:membrane-associated PAP2 superfamily phosphatase